MGIMPKYVFRSSSLQRPIPRRGRLIGDVRSINFTRLRQAAEIEKIAEKANKKRKREDKVAGRKLSQESKRNARHGSMHLKRFKRKLIGTNKNGSSVSVKVPKFVKNLQNANFDPKDVAIAIELEREEIIKTTEGNLMDPDAAIGFIHLVKKLGHAGLVSMEKRVNRSSDPKLTFRQKIANAIRQFNPAAAKDFERGGDLYFSLGKNNIQTVLRNARSKKPTGKPDPTKP